MNTRFGNKPKTIVEVMRRGAAEISHRLPTGWVANLQERSSPRLHERLDAMLEITSPDLERATLLVAAKKTVAMRDIVAIEDVLCHDAVRPDAHGLVMAPHLSASVRSRLVEVGLSFVDATGNMRITLSRPGLFLADSGANTDPWRGPGRPRESLKGTPAARVVRALVDFDRTWRMRDLIETSGASTGAAYRVIEYLESEGLVERDGTRAARVTVTDWVRMLRAWSADYEFVRDNRITRWIAPRGVGGLLDRIAEGSTSRTPVQPFRYAITGSIAAAEWAAYAPAALAAIYVTNAEAAGQAWGLRPTDASANTLLAEPGNDVMLERSWTNKAGLQVAAPAQVVVDLLTGPGRNPSEGEALLSWMKQNENVWRHDG